MQLNKIKKLLPINFRNLSTQKLEFSPSINSIFGPNGSGKSNLLEAIYFLANKKSFRKNAKFPQILNMDGDSLEVALQAVFQDDKDNDISVSAKLNQDEQFWTVNSSQIKRKINCEVIFISPFDSYVFHTKSEFRRQWFDSAISDINYEYKQILKKYTQSLRFRNTLLSKKPPKYREQIIANDRLMAEMSRVLTDFRLNFIEEVVPYCDDTFQKLFSEKHSLKISLESDFGRQPVEEIFKNLQNNLEKDEILGHTRKGIHRDDYVLQFNGLNSFEICSLGQQKMSYLSLNFAYIELFRYKLESYPIVLMDDVSSELDGSRWQRLIAYLASKSFQVFITTANEKFREELEKGIDVNKIYIAGGKVQ